MPNQQNIQTVEFFSEKFQKASGIYFADYLGLDVKDITDLRKKFTTDGIEFHVIKNTLAKLSVENAGLKGLDDVFGGPTAVALSFEDPTVPARIIKEFKKDHDLPEMKAFVFEGKVMDKASFSAVSNLPSQEVLLTKLVNGLSSPMTKLASTLNSVMSDFANVLANLKKSKTE
ncbi:MAG: 50S ribosomal protein L10 [Candidatus Marinimicrobia bacterium]|nr:50S ribosomal protein L10 [Candidatus Neomarinimicrobiota bacterium]|tara:strand:+ start:2208 stop:2726 length:519 start_codon:yes stop_codon:yes gene_type:complete